MMKEAYVRNTKNTRDSQLASQLARYIDGQIYVQGNTWQDKIMPSFQGISKEKWIRRALLAVNNMYDNLSFQNGATFFYTSENS